MENWTKDEEFQAKEEYLLMIDALRKSDEFSDEWTGRWDDFEKPIFGGRIRKIKGDKSKYMKYWFENQKIINDNNWNNLHNDDEHF